ncbi:MAG: hypothetical protein KGJ78_13625 [Alphaproteobacteria bacterium]|nr:hypothetical protein [Alphaproteobacteria bacterium]
MFLREIRVLALEPPADHCCATLRCGIERVGTPIGSNGMLIAAQALALDATLVTGNDREFSRIDGLKVENWRR